MSYKKLKKNYRGRKKGDAILVSTRVTGNIRRDILKEAYLQNLIRETRTFDINEAWNKLHVEGKRATKELRKIDLKAHKMNKKRLKLEAKTEVIAEVISILRRMKSTGRTRVGESQLKSIVASVMREKGIDAQKLGFKVI